MDKTDSRSIVLRLFSSRYLIGWRRSIWEQEKYNRQMYEIIS